MLNNKTGPKSMSMRQLYRQARHYTEVGIQGYRVPKHYEDPAAAIQTRSEHHHRKKRELKIKTYIDLQVYNKKDIPGVCKYNISPTKQMKQHKSKHNSADRKTYLDQAIEQSNKNKIPAPGQYNLLQMMGSKLAQSTSSVALKHEPVYSQKMLKLDRITCMDNAQYQGHVTPGVGQYQINRMIRAKTQGSTSKIVQRNPQYWVQYHKKKQQNDKKKQENMKPGAGAYNPKSLQYQLFEDKKKLHKHTSQSKLTKLKSADRFKTQSLINHKNSKLGPGKYNILNEWAPKQKNKKGILSVISKATPPSIYYH